MSDVRQTTRRQDAQDETPGGDVTKQQIIELGQSMERGYLAKIEELYTIIERLKARPKAQ